MTETLLYNISKHWRLAYVSLAAFLAILFDFFVWDKRLGLGFSLYIIIGLIGFISLSVVTRQFRQPKALLLLVPIFVLCTDVFLYNNLIIEALARPLILALMILFAVLSTFENPHKHKFSFIKLPFFGQGFLLFSKIGHLFKDMFSWGRQDKNGVYKKIILGILVALPFLYFFTVLFIMADSVFAESLKSFFSFSIDEEIIGKVIRTLFLFVFLSSLFYVTSGKEHILGEKNISIKKLDSIIVGVVLGLINSLFALFVFFQIKYFFGNAEFVLKSGKTFAEYARSGFFELVWVLILASLVVLVIYRSLTHHTQHWILKILSIVLVAQVFVVAISALKRMNLYQAEYGFTVLRLYVEWFIYFVMFLLNLLVLGLIFKWQFRNLFYSFLLSGLVALTIVCSVNVDLMIARKNISFAINSGKELDTFYLHSLSIDIAPALPELVRVMDTIKLRFNTEKNTYPILEDIKSKKELVKNIDSFLEFNWGRFQAREILKNL